MKSLIFDFDGTLADSFPLVVDIFHELTDENYDKSSQKMQDMRGHSTVEVAQKLKVPWWRLPFVVARGRKLMHERMQGVAPFLEMGPVIYQLHRNGYRLFIISTNSVKNIEALLDGHDLRQFFEDIEGDVAMFGKAKAIRRIMQEHDLEPEDCTYIGDEERDILAARQAGVQAAAVGWGYGIEQVLQAAKPDAIAHAPEDLLKIFDLKQV